MRVESLELPKYKSRGLVERGAVTRLFINSQDSSTNFHLFLPDFCDLSSRGLRDRGGSVLVTLVRTVATEVVR
jgi:hypothetical protein